jgi:hypothetical protein
LHAPRFLVHPSLGTADISVAHDGDYRASLQDFTTFLESLSEKVIEADETIPELPVKDIVCGPGNSITPSLWSDARRYFAYTEVTSRYDLCWHSALTSADVRFSKDQTPYKVSRVALHGGMALCSG